MTVEERLRQYAQRAVKQTVVISPKVEAMLRQANGGGHADIQQQLRLIDSARKREAEKRAEWNRGR